MSNALALPSEVDRAFAGWIASTCARFVPPLAFSEVRRGVQALSSLYVERRHQGRLASRAIDGDAKRAALATFQAPLHFLAAWAALDAAELPLAATPVARPMLVAPGATSPRPRTPSVHDLGAGTGAVGAALAHWLAAAAQGAPPAVHAIDVSGWALREARATGAAFGLALRTVRGRLPAAAPRPRAGDWIALGFFANELDDAARSGLVRWLELALDDGVGLLWLEPLARPVAPWWDALAAALAPRSVRAIETKRSIERPAWIERLDEAAGLDHRAIGARALVREPRAPASPRGR